MDIDRRLSTRNLKIDMLIDTHCHLSYFPENERNDIIKDAFANGISKIITISTDLQDIQTNIDIANEHKNVYAAIGVHPDNVAKCIIEEEKLIEICKSNKKIVAIGETGIDLHSNDNLNVQIMSFKRHISAAKMMNLPVIIHSRNAEQETKSIISKERGFNGVMHCFTGSYDLAKCALDNGLFISFSGIVTFKNAEDLREVLKKIPLNRILIETDAPFLAPQSFRGKQNKPSFLQHTFTSIKEILSIDEDILKQQIYDNSMELFDSINRS